MATSGISNTPLPFDEMLEEAASLVGGGQVSGEELRQCRRALDLALEDLHNQEILLWTLDTIEATTSIGQVTVSTSSDCVNVLWGHLSYQGRDMPLTAISYEEYANLSNKSQRGRPTQYMVDRRLDKPNIWLWPAPDREYVLKYARERSLEDTSLATNDVDIPKRFRPYAVDILASVLAEKRKLYDLAQVKKVSAEMKKDAALSEDRERTSLYIIPKVPRVI